MSGIGDIFSKLINTGQSLPPMPAAPAYPAPSTPYFKPGPYQTQLSPQDEQSFQSWVKTNNVPFDPSPTSDYDMRGYWKAANSGAPNTSLARSSFDGQLHFPDTFKTPYHKTFSNQSQYALPGAPAWQGDKLVDNKGNIISDETPTPAQTPTPTPQKSQ